MKNAIERIFSCTISFWYSRERARPKLEFCQAPGELTAKLLHGGVRGWRGTAINKKWRRRFSPKSSKLFPPDLELERHHFSDWIDFSTNETYVFFQPTSAGSKLIFASYDSLESSWRDLQDLHTCAPLRPQYIRKCSSNVFCIFRQNLPKLNFKIRYFWILFIDFCSDFDEILFRSQKSRKWRWKKKMSMIQQEHFVGISPIF